MNKRLVIESVIIVIIASAIGITYNAFIKEPIPLIYKEKPKVAVADSLLFSSINEAPQEIVYDEPQIKDNVDSVKTKAKKDTCEKVDLIENETEEEIVRKPEKTEQYASTEITASNKKGKLFGHLKEFNNWVSLEQVKKALGMSNIQFIDAREPEAFEHGKIGNAIHIFPEYEDENEYFETILSLDPNKTYIIYCTSYDCDLAEMLAHDILSFGHIKKLFIFPGGWDEWIKHADT
jgi:rhodanese-related sulfurtransferase